MNGFAKKIKYILPLCALLVTAILCLLIFSAYGAPESVSVLNNGSRLVAIPVGDDSPSYQWQISDSANGTFRDIDGATQKFYDITSNDKNGYIRVSACGTVSEPVGPIKNIITFDLSLAAVTIGSSISGKAPDGTSITGAHSADNVYVIMQSDNANYTKNGISFTGNYPNTPFDVTLQELNMGVPAVKFDQSPGASGSSYPSGGSIEIPATIGNAKNVILRLKGENIVRNITYYNAGDTSVKQSGILSSLKITDINGDGATDGGSLYMPVKVAPEEIDAFVAKNTNYNHWYAAIGGTDGQSYVENLTIAGGKLQVLTTLGDNCTAIGAGGNGYGQVTITGGEIVAHCNGTGAAIGGGIGWQEAGGIGYVTITGGKVYAKNHANIVSGGQTVGGVAIGGGSSFQKPGTGGEVVIEGGYVEAYGTFGNGIGGGNSSAAAGGTETVKISGGTVISNSIGGGNSKVGTGGSATVIVSGDANVTIIKGIGGGLSQSGSGGSATVTVNSGTLNCSGTIGGGQASGTEGTGGAATITVNGGTLNYTGTIGGGVGSGTGVGGNANITVTNGTLSAGGIGGGTGGDSGNGGDATVTVTNGTLNCTGTIGGGTGNGVGNGGDATLIVENGTLNADSLGGGTGGSLGDGGAADVTINGGTIRTGSIGGGNTLNTNGNLGYAKAMISGGDIQGQFIMAAGGTEPCSFTMTGGTLSNVNTADTSIYNYAKANGGAVYMDDPNGVVTLSGGTILNCSAQNGGAVYMTAGRF
ncbi:MAG: hypothetical protein IJW13_01535, partial [Clostridia bacterium]|nr:hypothetical protein [Clostridia bacterium]